MSQSLNNISPGNAYPNILGSGPNGATLEFVRINFWVLKLNIYYQWKRSDDDNWQPETFLPTGVYSFDRAGSAIQIRSELSTLSTCTVELVEEADLPECLIT